MSAPASMPSIQATHPWVTAHQQTVGFGVAYGPQLEPRLDWGALVDFVQTMEALGFDSYWTADHPRSYADCFAVLTALALKTTTLRLGPLVACVSYRSPALIARLAVDVDQASGGRLVLGLGIGRAVAEYEELGIPMPPVRERQRQLDRAIGEVQRRWEMMPSGPPQQSHVPLLIAGGGEAVTLRQVAKYADASNFGAHAAVGGAFTTTEVTHKFEVLRTHCAAAGRVYDAVLRTHWACPVVVGRTPEDVERKLAVVQNRLRTQYASSAVVGTPEEVISRFRALVAVGMQYFIVYVAPGDIDTLRLLAEEVFPAVQPR